MAFRDGILLHQSAGALPKAQFEQLLDAVQDVDMDEVKAQVAARELRGLTLPTASTRPPRGALARRRDLW